MPFNNVISRADATALIPVETSTEVIRSLAETNPILQLARRLPNMSRYQKSIPVQNALATGYFVNGETGLKQTTDVSWTNVTLQAEEIAAIVPIPEQVLDDSEFDIWEQVRPNVVEALNVAVSGAVLYGTNIPASWTTALGAAGLFARATAAGSVVSNAAFADTYEAIMGESEAGVDGLLMTIEADGYMATGHIASPAMRGRLRNVRDLNGVPLFVRSMQDSTRYELDGAPIYFPTDGSIVDATSWMFSGDWTQLVYAMRQDITYKVLTEAVIQDQSGNIVYNLAQQDMVALRVVMRMAVALPNPINRVNQTAATRCPIAVLTA
jgi:HK97 family phage major capsid protein